MNCELCHNLDPHGHEQSVQMEAPSHGVELLLQQRLFEMVQAALDGCRFCILLMNIARHFIPALPSTMPEPVLQIHLREGLATNVEIAGIDTSKVPRQTQILAAFYFYNPSYEKIPDLLSLGTVRNYSSRSDSEYCFRFIKESVQQCIQSHHRCQQTVPTAFPKRVLSIGHRSSDNIKLIEPNIAFGKYATLSHCWGGIQPLRATKETLEEMKSSIVWDDLPRTFQDAIKIARELQIRWIWIDSLCIIQDSESDWEKESSRMGDYYKNSWITISASSSPNGTIPFLKERESCWRPKGFWFTCDNEKRVEIYARRYPSGSMTLDEPFGRLATRGWTLQETILSTRILHYTEAEVIWECRTRGCSEDGTSLQDRHYIELSKMFLSCHTDPYDFWHGIAQFYSIRYLTFDSDKLPAVSGIASKVHEFIASDYLAGLWKKNLIVDLCWYRDYTLGASHNPGIRYEIYIAPSWSWASVRGGVDHPEFRSCLDTLVTTVDVGCTVRGGNTFGSVTDGFIVLQGPMVEATLKCQDPKDYLAYELNVVETGSILNTFYPDNILVKCQDVASSGKTGKAVRRGQKDDTPIPFQGQVYCIFLGNAVVEDYDEGREISSLLGIVVGESQTTDRAYERLGLVICKTVEILTVRAIEKIITII